MNITVSIDDALVQRVRIIAQNEGVSLNELIRRHLETVAGARGGEALVADLQALWESAPGHSGGRKITREEAYGDRR